MRKLTRKELRQMLNLKRGMKFLSINGALHRVTGVFWNGDPAENLRPYIAFCPLNGTAEHTLLLDDLLGARLECRRGKWVAFTNVAVPGAMVAQQVEFFALQPLLTNKHE